MVAITHQVVGASTAIGTYVILYTHQEQWNLDIDWRIGVLLLLGNLIGSIVPDLDHKGSLISKLLFFLPVYLVVHHRKETHSLLATGIFGIMMYFMLQNVPGGEWLALGLATGYLSHPVADIFNPAGVQLFYPLPWRIRFPITIETGSSGEKLFRIVHIGLCLILAYELLMKQAMV